MFTSVDAQSGSPAARSGRRCRRPCSGRRALFGLVRRHADRPATFRCRYQWVPITTLRFIHMAMVWQPMPADTMLPSGATVSLSRAAGTVRGGMAGGSAAWRGRGSWSRLQPVLGGLDAGLAAEALEQRADDACWTELAVVGQELLLFLVQLADDARRVRRGRRAPAWRISRKGRFSSSRTSLRGLRRTRARWSVPSGTACPS